MRTLPLIKLAALVALSALLASCDALGIESGTATAARKEADGKAIGSACRHAMRAIEDCYTLNTKASKSAVYAGWREMDEYMRENKIEGVAPVIPRKAAKPAEPASAPEGDEGGGHAAGGADEGGHGSPDKAGKADAEAPKPGDEPAPHAKAPRKVAAARQNTTH
jgi:hypothetical protein